MTLKTERIEKTIAWIGDSAAIGEHQRDERGAAWITVTDKITFSFASGLLPLLTHDVSHVLAATDEELFLPNLGLSANGPARDGDKARKEREARNEERVLAYETVLTRHFVGNGYDGPLKSGRRILVVVAGLVDANVDAILATLTIEQAKAEWDRKVALVRARLVGAA
jgi:hypothetical protein